MSSFSEKCALSDTRRGKRHNWRQIRSRSPAWLGVALVAIYPHEAGLAIGIAAVLALMWLSRRRYPAANAC